jgi:SAM-dependent methyltransferase
MLQDESTAALSRAFGEVADAYDRLRPGPSREALDWLLPEGAAAVLEIGAGTGIFTRLLAERVDQVTAVEPDDRMRAVLADRTRTIGGLKVLAGSAEALPAEDGSCDAVVAASAWHWVDEERAVPEVARVLRSGGRLALNWTGPDRTVDWMRRLWEGGVEYTPDEQGAIDARRRKRHAVNVDFGDPPPFGPPETARFQWTILMRKDDLVALAGTYSSVITMEAADRQAHFDAMSRYLDSVEDFAGMELLEVPMRSYCWRANKR